MNIPQNTYSISTIGPDITIFVITGGPCSGKTSGLSFLSQELTERGYKVLITPETATKLIMSGVHFGEHELDALDFQTEILLDIISQEQRMVSIAERYRDKGQKVVILCDRGTMDGEAYCSPEEFQTLIHELGHSYQSLCDARYHAVMHLKTTAYGAEEHYTLANNEARSESPSEARALDDKTLQAWQRHPHPRVIDNSTDFSGKLQKLLREVCAVLGDPIPLEQEDKFLVQTIDPSTIPVHFHEHYITQHYLVSPHPDDEIRIRSRKSDNGVSYYYTIKRHISPGIRSESERMITEREYYSLLELRDPRLESIEKRRICFFWKNQFFELDIFVSPDDSLTLLELEQTDRSPVFELPPFLNIIRNVTNETAYTNGGIAMGLARN